MMVRVLGALTCVLLLFPAAGCGSNDDGKAEEALSASLRKDNDLKVSKEDADCIAKGFVEKVGTEDLQEYGILTKDLKAKDDVGDVEMSKEDADGAADAMVDCVNAQELMIDAFGEGVPEEAKECLREELAESDVHDFLEGTFAGNQEAASQKLGTAISKCAPAGQ